jgi:hypothetical protein
VILSAIMSRDRWKKASYISKPRQMCFGHVATIKDLHKINLNLMTFWGIQLCCVFTELATGWDSERIMNLFPVGA